MFLKIKYISFIFFVIIFCGFDQGQDWGMWGGNASRNMVSPEKGIVKKFVAGKIHRKTEIVDMATTKNVKWVCKLGSESYGNPVIANGRVYVGTNNASPRDVRNVGDRGIVLCLDETSGKMIWQLAVPKLGAQKESDWEDLGICSSPTIDGDFVYLVTNRCEVVCLDVNGLKNGNQGYQDELKYMKSKDNKISELIATDADIIWRFDMIDELGVFPHNITSSSVLVVGDKLFVTTSNGMDKTHNNIPAPNAPCLVSLNKKTGALMGEEFSQISERLMHCNWSSPAYGTVNKQDTVIFGGGDGWCYGFDPVAVENKEEDFFVLPELWRFDCNPPSYRKDKEGKDIEYATFKGPSEIISTPVFHKNRVYVSIGQDPEHENGLGNLVCIDASKRGDVTLTAEIWSSKLLQRSLSTVAIYNNLVFAADYAGYLHCLDADTGKRYWRFDTGAHIWSSPLVADGHVYLGNEDGLFFVLKAEGGTEAQQVAEIDMDAPIYSTAVVANGVLYIATQSHLYALAKK